MVNRDAAWVEVAAARECEVGLVVVGEVVQEAMAEFSASGAGLEMVASVTV